MRKKLVNKILSILLLTSLIMTQMSDNVVFAEEAKEETAEDKEVVVIENVEELLAFAEKCDTDVWSADKLVELQADISLAGVDFEPIAVFAGTFNGNGHAITDLHYVGSGYADGFFRGVPLGEKTLCMDAFISDGGEKLRCVLSDADAYAKLAGTISYEVLTSVTKRSERVYLR